MAQAAGQRTIPQSKEALLKSYQKRLKDDIKSMIDNYLEIIKSAKLPKLDQDNSEQEQRETKISKPSQAEQDQYEVEVRAANIVRAGESLMKLVADIKQFLILNDFPSVNESIVQTTSIYKQMQADCDLKLLALRDDMAADLYELEEEYYSSMYK